MSRTRRPMASPPMFSHRYARTPSLGPAVRTGCKRRKNVVERCESFKGHSLTLAQATNLYRGRSQLLEATDDPSELWSVVTGGGCDAGSDLVDVRPAGLASCSVEASDGVPARLVLSKRILELDYGAAVARDEAKRGLAAELPGRGLQDHSVESVEKERLLALHRLCQRRR